MRNRPLGRSLAPEAHHGQVTPSQGLAEDAAAARRRRQAILVVAGVLALTAVLVGAALERYGGDRTATPVRAGWGGSEGHPSCVYDPGNGTVEATVLLEGDAPRHDVVTVTVTAYADENTSRPVGSSSRSVEVDGTVDLSVVLTIPVTKVPHVDEDGETACRLSMDQP